MSFTYDAEPAVAPADRAGERSRGEHGESAFATALAYLASLHGPAAKRELPDFTRQLATLLQAGTNPPEALETLRGEIQSRELRAAVTALEVATKRGLPLHAAMRRHPRVFDRVYTEIVAAGVKAGTLEKMLVPLADGLVTAEKIRSKVARAMIQPLFSLAATFLGGWYVIQKVVPTFAGIYEREGVELPAVTRALLALAEAAESVGDAGLIAAGLALLALPRVLAAPAVRAVTDRVVLRLPIVGPLARISSVSSFMRFFSMLLATDAIQEAEAIELAAQTARNSDVAARLANAARDVAAGTHKVSGALKKTGVVPPVYVQILRTGENTGKLTDLATYAANRLEEKVMDQVEKAQAAVVPLATCVVIAVVAVMLVGLYGPMTGLYQVLLR
ncbi:type II secretion system F family protein [Longimicrobium sp.]|uniref:type II secretion system F family protein n=1 Tax=Longimicrobium sp. TaxID=2029185 RepID=UPI002E37991E|nr:type II secretion system F family protein [Longimicrobium sp.]HEX6037788.1 type II secretion system F family protein [Longimicrobium sp.]